MLTLAHRVYFLLCGAWRRRYQLLLPALLMPIIGLAVGLLSPKHYQAHTSMLIQETAKMNPFLEDLAVSTMLKERIDGLKTLLHSRHILGAVARELQLADEQAPPDQLDNIIGELSAALSVEMAGKDLLRIEYRADDPANMEAVLTAVSHHFVEQLLAPERSSMQDSRFFLGEHLKHRQQELDAAEKALADFRSQHAAELPALHTSQVARLSQLRQRLAERSTELAGAQKRLGSIDQQLSQSNPVLGRLEESIVRIRGELALYRARYTDNHSLIRGALRNLRRLEQERRQLLSRDNPGLDADQLWDIASNNNIAGSDVQPLLISQLERLQLARSGVDALTEEVTSLNALIRELERKTAEYGQHASRLAELERDLKIKREFYDDLLLRHEQARLTGSLGIFEKDKRIKVIDRPFTPTRPANLPLWLFAVAGLAGGIALGCGLALLLEIGDTSLRRRDQLQALTGQPVLCRLPRFNQPSADLHFARQLAGASGPTHHNEV